MTLPTKESKKLTKPNKPWEKKSEWVIGYTKSFVTVVLESESVLWNKHQIMELLV